VAAMIAHTNQGLDEQQ